jgi:hypothetical protein
LINAAAPDAVDEYEKLRAAVLCAEPTPCPGLGIIHRQGLAAWIRVLGRPPHADGVDDHHSTLVSSPICHQPSGASELARVIASILVSIAVEPAHA